MPIRATVPAMLLALVLPFAGLRAADAPTDAEWKPVAEALVAGTDSALTQAEAITKQYPSWPDGFRAIAQAKLRASDAKGAWAAARQALSLNANDADAGAIGVQALAMQAANHDILASGKERSWKDVFVVADKFTDATDVGGKVAAQAAVAALTAGDGDALDRYLAAVKTRSGGSANPVIDFVAAKQALGAKDLPTALAALERAVAARPDYRDALYELGRVRVLAALSGPADKADELLTKADEAFAAAARLDNKDAASRFGLGRARLEHGKRMIAAGQGDAGESMLRSAINAIDDGMQLQPGNVDAKLWKGDAYLRLKRWDEAAQFLGQAKTLGASDRALPFNLAMALTNAGRSDEAANVLREVKAETPDEKLTLAMTLFKQGFYNNAHELLAEVYRELKPGTPKELEQWQGVTRYLAHCLREMAAKAQDPQAKEDLTKQASQTYLEAGENGDFPSRHWYVAMNAARSPEQAFLAGKQLMHWDGFLSVEAWKLMAGNYGYRITHGEGLPGLLKYGTAHLMLWSLIAVILVMLFLKGLIMPMMKPPKAARPATASARRPGAKPATASAKPASAAAKPGTAGLRKPPAARTKPASGAAPAPGGPKTPFSE